MCLGSDNFHNQSGSDLDIPAGELFGFNTGNFVEVPAGVICSSKVSSPSSGLGVSVTNCTEQEMGNALMATYPGS